VRVIKKRIYLENPAQQCVGFSFPQGEGSSVLISPWGKGKNHLLSFRMFRGGDLMKEYKMCRNRCELPWVPGVDVDPRNIPEDLRGPTQDGFGPLGPDDREEEVVSVGSPDGREVSES